MADVKPLLPAKQHPRHPPGLPIQWTWIRSTPPAASMGPLVRVVVGVKPAHFAQGRGAHHRLSRLDSPTTAAPDPPHESPMLPAHHALTTLVSEKVWASTPGMRILWKRLEGLLRELAESLLGRRSKDQPRSSELGTEVGRTLGGRWRGKIRRPRRQ